MTHNLYRQRSARKRLQYENDKDTTYDEYSQRIIDDQEIYDTENIEFESGLDGYEIIEIYWGVNAVTIRYKNKKLFVWHIVWI